MHKGYNIQLCRPLNSHDASLVPRLSRNANIYRMESLVSFLRKHDVIKIGPKQKGNVLHVVQPTMLQHSVCMIFDSRKLDTCSKLPATFVPFPVLSLICPRTIKWHLPRVYLWRFSREKKYQALHACTTSMFAFQSMGAWERGYHDATLRHTISNLISQKISDILP